MMYRGTISDNVSFDTEEELFAYQQGMADAIEEFARLLKKEMGCDTSNYTTTNKCYEFSKIVNDIAEQLKGDKNE